MLSKGNNTTVYVKCCQKLMIRFYKYLCSLLAAITKVVCRRGILKDKYNFGSYRVTYLPNPKSKTYSTDTVAYKAAQLWSVLPTWY